jgi:hypothetical protein
MNKVIVATGTMALSLCILTGCGSSNSSGTNSQAVSEEAGAATASEATAIATSMTQADVIGSAGTGASVGAIKPLAYKPEGVISSCASVDVTSSGSDGWTAETLTFTAPPCIFTGARGFVTLDVTGAIALTRSNGDGFNFTSTSTNLEWAYTTANNTTYSETRNGTRAITATASGASAASNITAVFAGAKHDGTLVHAGSSTFTPAEGSSIVAGEPLPSGTFTHTGTDTWTGSDGNVGTFNLTTITPLAYDASCKDTMPSVFDSGELQIQKTTDTSSRVTTITWSNCGAPTITYMGSN